MDPSNSFIKQVSNLLTYGIFFALQNFPLDNLLFLGLWHLRKTVYQKMLSCNTDGNCLHFYNICMVWWERDLLFYISNFFRQ